jgi:tetratricopeptide (TPR) repeat protein
MNPTCLHCSSTDTVWKPKAGKWECHACEERFEGEAPSGGASTPAPLSTKADKPKRIFFSYGHDANRELVDRFKADLEDRGHQVWIDYKEIGSWDDWKGAITRGIHDAQLAIAFLSIHSTRDPGVCRNEVAMALQHFGKVYPVLVEEVPRESIPVTIAHLQWPDLSRWREFRDQEDLDFERFYEEKFLEIVSRVEGEASRFASESAVLRRVLNPVSFEGSFAQHLEGFVGREWVFDKFEHWLNDQPHSRVFWLKAGPGFGKTAIAVNLATRYRAAVVGTWFCDEQSIDLRDPLRAVCTLAFQLALRWDDYRARLLPRLGLFAGSAHAQVAEALEALSKKNLPDLFSHLIAEPLAGLILREHKLVILVDALDEATDATGQNALSALISGKFLELPQWISFVVTSRPDASVMGHLQRFKPFEMEAGDERNFSDLMHYCEVRLTLLTAFSDLDESERQGFYQVLVEKSEGMVLYLRMVDEGLKEGILGLNDIERMETGLGGLYSRYYQTFEHRFGSNFVESVQPLLRLVLAAPGPLPLEMASEILSISKEQAKRIRAQMGSYLVDGAKGLSLFHQTLGEWLSSDASGSFFTDPKMCISQLGEFLWDCFEKRQKNEYDLTFPLSWEEWVVGWLPDLIPSMQQEDDFDEVYDFACFLNERCRLQVAEALYRRALKGREKVLGAEHPNTLKSLNNFGNFLKTKGDYEGAEAQYRRALEGREKILGVEHTQTLSSLKNLVTLLNDKGDYKGAEALYRRALEGIEKFLSVGHHDKPLNINNYGILLSGKEHFMCEEALVRCFLEGREKILGVEHRDTLASFDSLGILLVDSFAHRDAEVLLRRALDIREKILGPEHPDTLSSLNNLGNLLCDLGDYEDAEALHRRALKGTENILGAEHPKTHRCLNNLGILLKAKGDYEGAEALYRRALEGREKILGAEHPDTLASLNNLGILLRDIGDYEGAASLFRRAVEGFEKVLGVEHISTIYRQMRLGSILETKGDYEDAEVLYRRALKGRCKIQGWDHEDTWENLYVLGQLLCVKSDYEGAESLYRGASEEIDKALGNKLGGRSLLKCQKHFGSILNRQGKTREAASLLSRYVECSNAALLELRYNLACYECLSGNEEHARQLITDELIENEDPAARKAQMLEDTDFETIHDFIRHFPIS